MTNTPSRPYKRRAGKTVTDENRATALREEMRQADITIREATERRRKLALEAYSIGMTLEAVGEAAGVSHVAISQWVKAARDDRRALE